jgi:hypothetical protein
MKKFILVLAAAVLCSPLIVSQAQASVVKKHKAHRAHHASHHHVRHHKHA